MLFVAFLLSFTNVPVAMKCSGRAQWIDRTKKKQTQNAVNCKGLFLSLFLSLQLFFFCLFHALCSAATITTTTTTNVNVRGYRCGVAFIIALGTKILPVVKVLNHNNCSHSSITSLLGRDAVIPVFVLSHYRCVYLFSCI